MKGIFRAILVGVLFFVGACSAIPDSFSFKRTGKEFSDPKWTNFEDVEKSFAYIQEKIETEKKVTVADLNNLGFGPKAKNVHEVGYLELVKLLVGEQGDPNRLPEKMRPCIDKKENCYGLVAAISSADTMGEESLFKRMISGEKKTVATGWKFSAVFAVEKSGQEDKVVFAYVREKGGNIFQRKEEDDQPSAVINVIRPASLLGGFGF